MSGKYISARNAFGSGDLSWPADQIMAQLVSAQYVFDETHKALSDLSGAVGSPIRLSGTKMVNGWARADAMLFKQVKGPSVCAVIFYRDGDAGVVLIGYSDQIERFPMLPNGGDIELDVMEPGIFRI